MRTSLQKIKRSWRILEHSLEGKNIFWLLNPRIVHWALTLGTHIYSHYSPKLQSSQALPFAEHFFKSVWTYFGLFDPYNLLLRWTGKTCTHFIVERKWHSLTQDPIVAPWGRTWCTNLDFVNLSPAFFYVSVCKNLVSVSVVGF